MLKKQGEFRVEISKIEKNFRLFNWHGAKNFLALPESKQYQGGVRFNVNGLKHKGLVMVELRWMDDYTVSFLSKKGEVKKKVEGVYCDMLVHILDWAEGK